MPCVNLVNTLTSQDSFEMSWLYKVRSKDFILSKLSEKDIQSAWVLVCELCFSCLPIFFFFFVELFVFVFFMSFMFESFDDDFRVCYNCCDIIVFAFK